MEENQNHRSMDSQSIWLKSVKSEPDWLDLTNPWLKEVIKSDPELIFSILYAKFHPPSLSSTLLLSDWQLHSMRLRSGSVRHRSGIDGLSFSYSGLSPWDLHPLWAGVSILCINKAQAAFSNLVRVGLRSCFHCNTRIFLLWINKLWRLYRVVHVFVWIPSVMLLMW